MLLFKRGDDQRPQERRFSNSRWGIQQREPGGEDFAAEKFGVPLPSLKDVPFRPLKWTESHIGTRQRGGQYLGSGLTRYTQAAPCPGASVADTRLAKTLGSMRIKSVFSRFHASSSMKE